MIWQGKYIHGMLMMCFKLVCKYITNYTSEKLHLFECKAEIL